MSRNLVESSKSRRRALLIFSILVLLIALPIIVATAPENQQQGIQTVDAPTNPLGSNDVALRAKQQQQQQSRHAPTRAIKRCTRQSIIFARQMLIHELNQLNNLIPVWLNDLDKDELVEAQRHSLSNIVMSGFGARLLHSDGQPLIEIESSRFQSHSASTATRSDNNNTGAPAAPRQPLSVKLIRRHQDRCYLNSDKSQFTYVIGLSIGPIEHHLDVVYNLPKDLRLSQPIGWRYGQIVIHVPKMIYEVTLKQASNYRLNSLGPLASNCPLDIVDVLYLPPNLYTTTAIIPDSAPPSDARAARLSSAGQLASINKPLMSITSSGLALNNQTLLQVERLFDDYTRPTISRRLRQMLRFYLNTKTLPLSSA